MRHALSIVSTGVMIFMMMAIYSCSKEPTVPSESTAPDARIIRHIPTLPDTAISTFKVFATGLINPRGLKFGPDGYLYVAEAGIGGTNSTVGDCKQVPAPVGPYTGGYTARISRISPDGEVETVAENLPSALDAEGSTLGVADVAFIGNTLYALLAGGGCSHGNPNTPNGIIRVNPDGSWKMIANLSEWQQNHPTAVIEEDDFEPDGSWYSMMSYHGNLYAVEPNHGEMVKITPDGKISRVVDISASYGHIVPTALDTRTNLFSPFYVGNLSTFPLSPGASKIFKVTQQGNISVWAEGFTAVLGITFDRFGHAYVLENTTNNPFPTPGTGDILRVNSFGLKVPIVKGLTFPTAMTFGPDGKLYVSNFGFGPPLGQVVQIEIPTLREMAMRQ